MTFRQIVKLEVKDMFAKEKKITDICSNKSTVIKKDENKIFFTEKITDILFGSTIQIEMNKWFRENVLTNEILDNQVEYERYLEKEKGQERRLINKRNDFLERTGIKLIMDDIKKYCEFDDVLAALESCNGITKYSKKYSMEKYKYKNRYLKKNRLEGEDSSEYDNYEDLLYLSKEILYMTLRKNCYTGARRAKRIVKILEYL